MQTNILLFGLGNRNFLLKNIVTKITAEKSYIYAAISRIAWKMNINKFHNSSGSSIKKPWSTREFIRLATYIAQLCHINLRRFRLAKAELIMAFEQGFPRASIFSLYHHGPFNQSFEKYLRLEISQGFLKETTHGLELTNKGENYVKTMFLPSDCDDYCNQLAELLLMPENELITRAYKSSGFKVDRIKGKLIYHLLSLEDFMGDGTLAGTSQQILLGTFLSKIIELEGFLGDMFYLPKVSVESLPECLRIRQDMRKICKKTRIPASKALQLVELKNVVLNRFAYILAVHSVNVVKNRFVSFQEIYYMTHDWALEYRKRKRSKRYLSENEVQNLEKRKVQISLRKVVKNDLNVLVKAGLLRRDKQTNSYAVNALSFSDGEVTLYLPSAQSIGEQYELLCDELSILQREFRGYDRAFNGGVKALKYEVDLELPHVRIVDYTEKNLQLTKFRGQGIEMDRVELLQIIHRIYRKIFEAIKKLTELDRFQKGIRIQVILVMRDAISAWQAAVDEFPDTPIGMIGHVRRTEGNKVTGVDVSFDRCEDPSEFDVVVIVDPMVATGSTILRIIKYLKAKCSRRGEPVFIVSSILVSREAAKKLSDVLICCLSLEKSMKGVWLNPGLRGLKDLGDLICKTSIDWTRMHA